MRFTCKASTLAVGAAALFAISTPVLADGMPAPRRAPAPVAAYEPPVAAVTEPARGPCYVRADVGYGWSASDHGTASITPAGGFATATGRVQGSDFEGSWFGEAGFGCSFVRQSFVGGNSIKDSGYAVTAPTGFRGDVTFGFHGSRDYSGVPLNPPPLPIVLTPAPLDPVHARVQTNTLMFNLYYDFATMHGFTPYVGAGLGLAFVDLHNTTFTNGVTVRPGNVDDTNLAWSLMAGVGRDIGRGMILDVGYRYLNMGDIAVNNAGLGYGLRINDISEHQVKVGLRIPIH